MSRTNRLVFILLLTAAIIFAQGLTLGEKSQIAIASASTLAAACSQRYEASNSYSPRENSSIHHNQPCFSWPEDFSVDAFELQISRDPNFPDSGSTSTHLVPGTSFRPENHLSPGDWYWRVRGNGSWESSPILHFAQTAPRDADTTGPEISPVSLSITSPEQALQLRLYDPSGIMNCAVSVSGIEDKSFETACNEGLVEVIPSGGWPRGAHRLRVEALDQLGNKTIKHVLVAVAPAPAGSLQRTSQQNFSKADASEFPLGIYNVRESYFAKVKAAGFNLVHLYDWEYSNNNAPVKEWLDAVHAAGLKAVVGFDRGRSSNQGLLQMNLDHVAERVAAFKDHPALYAWYLFDEPDLKNQYISPRNLQTIYSTIKELDPYHPVIVTFYYDSSIERYGDGSYDFCWIMAYLDPHINDTKIRKYTNVLGPNGNYLVINKSYDWDLSVRLQNRLPVNDEDFLPNLAYMRADAYLALIHGSKGLSWWWFGDNRREYVSVGDTPIAWGWISQVVAEINQLVPVLNGSGKDLAVELINDSPLTIPRARAIQNGSLITLIAVNTSTSDEAHITLKSAEFPSQATASGKFNTPSNMVQNHEIRVVLPPLGAYVYEIRTE
jgi:hypothetical protein